MPTLYYKENGEWKPIDIGDIKHDRFTMGSTNYSYNFDEPFSEGRKPIVVANATDGKDVNVTSVSRSGFTVRGSSAAEVSFFAAQGGILTYQNANGVELLNFYLDEVKSDQNGAQRVAAYFDPLFGTMSWSDMSKMSQVVAAFPSLFSGYVGKTRTVNMGSYGGNITFEVVGIDCDTNSSETGAITFLADKCITKRAMNSSHTASGGWASCAMRSWLSGTVLPAMPADLRAAIAIVNKVNTPGYGTSSTQDKLWIPSNAEVGFGGNEGSAYGVFTNNSSRIRQYNGSNTKWWLRSVEASNRFYTVFNDGTSNSYGAGNADSGVVPGFCI